MRKIYSLVTLMLLFVAGVNAQSLADRYDAVGFGESGAMVDDLSNLPEEGIAIQIGRHTTKAFMQTNDAGQVFFRNKLNNYSLFTFVPVEGAEDTYYLKSTATGKYLANPGLSNNRVEMVDNTVRASRIIVKNVKTWESSDALNEAITNGDPEYDRLTATLDELGEVADYTFKFSNIYENDTLSLGFGANIDYNNIPIWSTSSTWNCWQFYTVEPLSAYNALQELFNEAYPNGQSSIDALEGGSDPGQVDQDAIDLFQEAYDNANALLGGTPTDEECIAAYEAILAAQEAIAAGSHNVTEGYFYISSLRSASNATYIDDDNLVHWTYGTTWTEPTTPTANDAKYIWHFTSAGKNENGDDLFYIQNIWTGRYLGANTKSATQGGAVNKAIPTTETPEEKYIVNVHPSIAHAFNMTSSTRLVSSENESNLYPAFHAGGDHSYVVWWSKDAGEGSAWRLLSIPEEDVIAVKGEIEQVQKNQALSELVNTVNARVAQGRAYTSDATHSADFSEVTGLVEDAAQLFTNAQEQAEGPIENAIDGNSGTFFHSAWQTSSFETGDLPEGVIYHNLVADLSKAVSNVIVKIAARGATFISNLPGTVHVYGANEFDEEAFMAGDYSNWEDCGVVTFSYNDSLIIGTDTIANASGLTTLELGKPYQYIRLDVISRNGGNDLASAAVQNRWFNLSEIRFYEATYDKENSINEQVDADIMAELNNQLEIAGEELIDEVATQETYDALQAAYEAYLNNLPDPQIAADLLAEARAQAEAAVEGTELGYFEAGAKDELEAALNDVEDQVKPMMTLAEVNAVKEAINAALAVFNSHLIQPEDGVYYHIISATSSEADNSAAGNYVYSSRNGGDLSWGYGDKADEIMYTYSTMWKAEKNADGSYSFRNALSGEYMAQMKGNSQRMVTRAEADSAHISLRSAKVAGLFNLVHGEGIYANAEPGTNARVVTWGTANGTDNSAFRFVEAEAEMPTTKCEIVTTTLSPATLPVSFIVPSTSDKFYKVLGTKEINGQLNLILGEYAEGDVIVGGTPFFAQFDDAESDVLFIDLCDADGNEINSLDEITYATEPVIANGLQGVLAATTTNKGAGILRDGNILLAEAGDAVAANSAYLVDVPATEEDGDVQILMENFTTSINNTTIVAPANKAVYDLSGRRVMKAQKGLYIINGQKVLVK